METASTEGLQQRKAVEEKMKRWGRLIALILLLLVGLAILFYPSFSNWWNERRAARLMSSYEEAVQELDNSDLEAMFAEAQEFNARLRGEYIPDAFAERDPERDYEYEEVLNVTGDGLMATVEIPCINVQLPIFHYTTDDVLEKGAGHLAGSSLPVGGENTHAIISAHRGLPSAKLFTDLDRVTEGDFFYIHVLEETLAYKVDQIKVVEPSETEDLLVIEGGDYCTLVTCTPYAVNSHRLLVRGQRSTPFSQEQYEEEQQHTVGPRGVSVLIRILCVAGGIGIAALFLLIRALRNKLKARRSAVKDKESDEPEEEVQPEKAEGRDEGTDTAEKEE